MLSATIHLEVCVQALLSKSQNFLGQDKTRSESMKVILAAGESTQESDFCMAKSTKTKKTSMNISYLRGEENFDIGNARFGREEKNW